MNQLFESSFRHAGIGMAIVGPNGEFLRVNDAFCNISGHDRDSLLGCCFQDITHPNDIDKDLAYFNQLNQGKIDKYNLQKRYIAKDKSVRYILLTVSKAEDPESNVRYIAQIQDRQEIYQARIDLEESQQLLDQTQSLARIGGWKYFVNNKQIQWSKIVYDIYEVPCAYEITEKSVLNFFPNKAKNKAKNALKEAKENGISYDLELPFVTAKNNKLWVRWLGHPVMVDGTVVHIVGCIMDITEQVQLRNKLEKANSELSHFAYAASHDLREPLRKVTAFGDLLKKSLSGKINEKEERFMNHMIKGAKKMQQQIDDLLILSKVSTVDLKLEEVDLNQVISESLEDVATSIIDSDARIKVDKLPIIMASKPLVRSLVFNIISNAIKYRSDDRPLNVHIWHELKNGIPAIFIQDNGIGFDSKYKEHIFEPFKRLHTGERYGGNGIGLATCSRVCERHGWKIGVDSKENEGATFWFTTEAIHGE